MSKSKAVGLMDKRITFQQKVIGSDGSNQRLITGWEDITVNPTVYAEVIENYGSENFQADQLVGLTTAKIRIRYRTDLTIEYRVSYNDKFYDIHAILEHGRREYLLLMCESGGQYKE